MANQRTRKGISISTAMVHQTAMMGRPCRMENWHRFVVNGKVILFLIYSSVMRTHNDDVEPWREFRYAIFEGYRSHGGGIFSDSAVIGKWTGK